jgi:NAD(P)-dependent dehydrogenase (short-subunit alcohol dehydrogenase family)
MQMELEGTGVRASMVRPGQTLTEIGVDWDADETVATLMTGSDGAWPATTLPRPEAVAAAVAHDRARTPRGAPDMIEVQPGGPVEE